MERGGSGPERDLCTISVSYGTWPPREMVCGPSLCILFHSSLSPAGTHRSRWTRGHRLLFMSFLRLTCLCLHPQILWWPESNSLSSGIFPKNFRPEYFLFYWIVVTLEISKFFPLLFKRQISLPGGWRAEGRGLNPAFCSLTHHSTQRQDTATQLCAPSKNG